MSTFDVALPKNFRQRYKLLDLYKTNRVYADVMNTLKLSEIPVDFDTIRAVENPALQMVQYHVDHVFPGTLRRAMPLIAEGNPALAQAAMQILLWSNMGQQKDTIIDETATYGDEFIKVAPKDDGSKIYLRGRHPKEATEFEEDSERNITLMRLDVDLENPTADGPTTWTELWSKDENLYAAWLHNKGVGEDLTNLGNTTERALITDFGHDFVPFVRSPFEAKARPNERSRGVFELHLQAIDQINRLITELDDMYQEHGEGVWAVMRNQAGLGSLSEIAAAADDDVGEPSERVAHGRRLVMLPGLSNMADMVPGIDYKAGLDKVEDRRKGLERSRAELRYFRGVETGYPAAATIRMHQAPAIARAEACRGNAEDAMLKAIKMALSMGIDRNLFPDIGTFESGGFNDLMFEERPIVPETPTEKTAREQAEAQIMDSYARNGLLRLYFTERGYSDADATRLSQEALTNTSRARISQTVNS